MKVVERFAPSPSGHLHLGHIYSAAQGFDAAIKAGGKWLLRIEDIDFTRCKETYIDAIYDDLYWLGFHWEEPVMIQSNRREAYQSALEKLRDLGVIYGCQCTRRDIALSAPHGKTDRYPGTCRTLGLSGDGLAWRLDAKKASQLTGALSYREIGEGRDEKMVIDPSLVGDVVLARRDIETSYHLAVVVDDAAQGITHITRGQDLEKETPIHIILQYLLGYPKLIYRHHQLIKDESGKRLAKRDDARSIQYFRQARKTKEEVLKMAKISENSPLFSC